MLKTLSKSELNDGNLPVSDSFASTIISTEAGQAGTYIFCSSCPVPWGGSEELWSDAAIALSRAGKQVFAIKTNVDFEHRRIKSLQAADVVVDDYDIDRAAHKHKYLYRIIPNRFKNPDFDDKFAWLCRRLSSLKPDLVIVSQGENFDGLRFVWACQECRLPYVLISQKASDHIWPDDFLLPIMRRAYVEAKRAFFVSKHNQDLTELQIGNRLTNAEVVRNPYMTPVDEPLPWPSKNSGRYKLACVARLFTTEKGQDILLQVLAQEKWKSRLLDITFYGEGPHRSTLIAMTSLLGLDNVNFAGFTWDVVDIWRHHHALVMPSRCEGLPLSLVEAMYCGRPAIVTRVGGNAEVVDDGETGFIAEGPSKAEVDLALERAWSCREEWEALGKEASQRIRLLVKSGAGDVLAHKLTSLSQK